VIVVLCWITRNQLFKYHINITETDSCIQLTETVFTCPRVCQFCIKRINTRCAIVHISNN